MASSADLETQTRQQRTFVGEAEGLQAESEMAESSWSVQAKWKYRSLQKTKNSGGANRFLNTLFFFFFNKALMCCFKEVNAGKKCEIFLTTTIFLEESKWCRETLAWTGIPDFFSPHA